MARALRWDGVVPEWKNPAGEFQPISVEEFAKLHADLEAKRWAGRGGVVDGPAVAARGMGFDHDRRGARIVVEPQAQDVLVRWHAGQAPAGCKALRRGRACLSESPMQRAGRCLR